MAPQWAGEAARASGGYAAPAGPSTRVYGPTTGKEKGRGSDPRPCESSPRCVVRVGPVPPRPPDIRPLRRHAFGVIP